MKPFLIAVAALALVAAQPVLAQLAPPNPSGVTYGHVHLSVSNADVMKKLWVDQFGAVLSTKGTFTIAKLTVLRAIEPAFLTVTIKNAQGRPPKLVPFYGALAHAILFRSGSLDYFHTHVCAPGAAGWLSLAAALRMHDLWIASLRSR